MKRISCVLILVGYMVLSSCDNYFDVEMDSTRVLSGHVFSDDLNATAAVNGMYQSMVASSFGGGGSGVAVLAGLSSDELHNILSDETYMVFEMNRLEADNAFVKQFWDNTYSIIYKANDIIDELGKSTGVSDSVRKQLVGESLFVRAFCHFYLVNIFGDVPIVNTSDYRLNAVLTRNSVIDVYQQIINDLKRAQEFLKNDYINGDRSRPNRLAATSLLSRVYLYVGDWDNAIKQASEVIENPQMDFGLDLGGVFHKDSRETIWQLASETGFNTKDAAVFILEATPSSSNQGVSDSLLQSFQVGDGRRDAWVGRFFDEGSELEFYFPYKYKAPYYGSTSEFYIVFRLAEQLLIRSEAYAKKGNQEAALQDLNRVRVRAGLEGVLLDDIFSDDELMSFIEYERRIEFFSEWGHRWLDLKRTDRARIVLGEKTGWKASDQLYPIPQDEFMRNPKLGLQNTGY